MIRLIVALFLISVISAFPSTTFTQGPVLQKILSNQEAFTPEDAFFITGASLNLGSNPENKDQLCEIAREGLSNVASFESVFHSVFVSESLKCGRNANQNVASLLLSAQFSSLSMESVYYATSAAFLLKENKHLNFPSSRMAPALDRISDLITSDGTVKNNESDDSGTLYHSALAFKVASYFDSDDLSSDQEFVVELLNENAEELLELYTETEDGLLYIDENDSRLGFRVTNALLTGVYQLTQDVDVIVEADILDGVVEQFLLNCPFSNLENMYHFSNVLSMVTQDEFPSILVVSIPKTSFSATNKNDGNLIVRVSNLQGEEIPNVKVFLMTASAFSDDAVLYSNQPLTKDSNIDYVFNFLTNKPQQGFYSLDIGVQVDNGAILSTTRSVKVATSVSIPSFEVKVIDTQDKDTIASQSIKNNQKLSNLKISYYNTLDISFVVKNQANNKPTTVQQAVVHFVGDKTEASFAASFQDGKYRAVLDMRDVGKDLWYISGEYEISAIIGDPFIDNSFILDLGSSTLNFPPSLAVQANENVYITKPEIEHIFRQPEKRPSEPVSTAFSVAVAIPFVLFLLFLALTGIPINVPSGAGIIFSILFFLSIIAIFGSYAAFWFNQYNMFETLQHLIVIGIFAFIVGFKALRAKAIKRTAPANGKSKVE